MEFTQDSKSDFYTCEPEVISTFSGKVFPVLVEEVMFYSVVELLDDTLSYYLLTFCLIDFLF